MTRATILLTINAVLLIGGLAFGFHWGRVSLQARMDAQTVAAQAQAMETAKALAAAEQARARLSQALEDAANAEPVSTAACLPRSRVLRLNQR